MESFYSIWKKYEGAFDSICKFCLARQNAYDVTKPMIILEQSLSPEDWGGLLGYLLSRTLIRSNEEQGLTWRTEGCDIFLPYLVLLFAYCFPEPYWALLDLY